MKVLENVIIYRRGKRMIGTRFIREPREMSPVFYKRMFKWIKDKSLNVQIMISGKWTTEVVQEKDLIK